MDELYGMWFIEIQSSYFFKKNIMSSLNMTDASGLTILKYLFESFTLKYLNKIWKAFSMADWLVYIPL